MLFGRTRLNDDVVLVVDNLLEVLRLHPKQRGDFVRKTLEVPDVCDRNTQRNVSHALTTHRFLCHLYAAPVADDALVANTLVLATVTLPVFDRTEDFLTEQSVFLRLE